MKVKDVMTRHVQVCTPDNDLASVAMIMLKNDCGMVPVMKYDCEVVGVITDRDICLAVATRIGCRQTLRSAKCFLRISMPAIHRRTSVMR